MGLTVNRQPSKMDILTVNRQLKLAVKSVEYLLSRAIIASNNGVNSCTGTFPL